MLTIEGLCCTNIFDEPTVDRGFKANFIDFKDCVRIASKHSCIIYGLSSYTLQQTKKVTNSRSNFTMAWEDYTTYCFLMTSRRCSIISMPNCGKRRHIKIKTGCHSLHDISNENHQRFVDFASTRNLIIKSICLLHKPIHKSTWASPDTFN